jgi:ubiquinone/menaquinone biosynthesis C-methylase UbiE
MNLLHRWYCRSAGWTRVMQQFVLPAVLGRLELGDHVLEIGPGPGVTTDWLRTRVPHLTAVEIDHALAQSLARRMEGTNVRVVEGDATKMQFPDNTFSAAVSFTMLHHVPSVELQDRLLSEVCRVLVPGGLLTGTDSTPNVRWRLFHVLDTCVPVDAATFPQRLEAAGFVDTGVVTRPGGGLSFRGRKPA